LGDGAEVNFEGKYGNEIIARYDSLEQFMEARVNKRKKP
jgi:hypothetical protein